jgi:hypothetical protein
VLSIEINPAFIELDDVDLDQEVAIVNGQRLPSKTPTTWPTSSAPPSESNLIPGGKSLSGDGSHSPVVQARVPEEVRARLNAIAERRGVRPSRLLREAIDQLIEREESRGS